jgi:DNA polymerase-3 subunit gamma/tau
VLYPSASPWYFGFMPYEVTATRKRPQNFEQLAGQEFVAATLESSLATGRIAHAYLFSGPRGCGKTSTARILAKALNCEKGPTATPCGECDSCRAISNGSSLDVIEIDGASNTSVENVRQIKDEVLFPPNSSRYKIYIIDEVHMLSTSAFNALLKTIEEPPPYVIFMFATTEPHKVPATIKSRCQQFTFRLVSADIVKGLLATVASESGIEAEDEALLWIARESGGSIRDAYTLFDQVVSFSEGKISASLIREKLGLVGQDRMNELFLHFVEGDTAAALSFLDSIVMGGVSPEQFLLDSVEYSRALLLLKNGIKKEALLGAPIQSFDGRIVEALSVERIEQVLAILLETYRHLKESIDPRYDLDLAAAKLSHIRLYVAPSDLARAIGSLKRYLEKGGAAREERTAEPRAETTPTSVAKEKTTHFEPVENPTAAESVVAKEAAVSPVEPVKVISGTGGIDLAALKSAIIADVKKNNAFLAAALGKSSPWYLDGTSITIPVAGQMEFDLVRRFIGIIAEISTQRLGASRKLEVVKSEKIAGVSSSIEDLDASNSQVISSMKDVDVPSAQAALSGSKVDVPEGSGNVGADRSYGSYQSCGSVKEILPREQETISRIERIFKGSVIGYASPSPQVIPQTEDTGARKAGTPVSRNTPDEQEIDLDSARPEFIDADESAYE